jgi:hypothetical protein
MIDKTSDLSARVARLESKLRRAYGIAMASGAVAVAMGTTAFLRQPQVPDVIRTRQLIIQDQAGRDRIVMGAPVQDNFNRVSPTTGMAIRDSLGRERFGVGLDTRGNMGLGLDAPTCTSNPCNTERINLVADAEGGSHIRLLDRQTGAAALLYLADDDRAYLEFLRVTSDSIRRRQLGLRGDSLISQARR